MSTNANDIHLTPEQREKIASISDRTGLPWEELLDNLLAKAAFPTVNGQSDPRSALEAFQEAGVIGSIDGPGDLGTNPKHMEGFGRDEPHADSD